MRKCDCSHIKVNKWVVQVLHAEPHEQQQSVHNHLLPKRHCNRHNRYAMAGSYSRQNAQTQHLATYAFSASAAVMPHKQQC
jgi:hypothetical protein